MEDNPRRTARAKVVDALARRPELDPAEIVRHELRPEELRDVATRLGVSRSGTAAQVAARLARLLRWRPFEEAREYARGLGVRNHLEWRAHVGSGDAPADVPRGPDATYRDLGWSGWGDFLGTGNKGRFEFAYRPFAEARAFVRRLGLTSSPEWVAWCRGDRPDLPPRPDDVPTNPHRTYAKEWRGMGDWLGTGRIQTQRRRYRWFANARAFVRSLGLKNQTEYFAWWREHGGEALDLPGHPERTYAKAWRGWGDFLGTGNVAPRDRTFLPFAQARRFARGLGLASIREWRLWLEGALPGKPPRPDTIPANPHVHFRGRGWTTWGDFLGTGTVHNARRAFWSFTKARAFVRRLRLRNQNEWNVWRSEGLPGLPRRPREIPTNPSRTYAREWVDWADWLGKPPGARRRWRPFAQARAFARSLGLRSAAEWKAYAAGRRPGLPWKPVDVPASPAVAYEEAGWAGWADWLRGRA